MNLRFWVDTSLLRFLIAFGARGNIGIPWALLWDPAVGYQAFGSVPPEVVAVETALSATR